MKFTRLYLITPRMICNLERGLPALSKALMPLVGQALQRGCSNLEVLKVCHEALQIDPQQ